MLYTIKLLCERQVSIFIQIKDVNNMLAILKIDFDIIGDEKVLEVGGRDQHFRFTCDSLEGCIRLKY